jgi:hypothetical protein
MTTSRLERSSSQATPSSSRSAISCNNAKLMVKP